MKIQDARPFLGTDNHSVTHGAAQRRKAPETVLSRAAEVFISKRGAKLQRDAAIPDDLLTPAELALAADEKEREDKQAKKAQAKEIEERIASDKTLSDEVFGSGVRKTIPSPRTNGRRRSTWCRFTAATSADCSLP